MIGDLKAENAILKEANEKLVNRSEQLLYTVAVKIIIYSYCTYYWLDSVFVSWIANIPMIGCQIKGARRLNAIFALSRCFKQSKNASISL